MTICRLGLRKQWEICLLCYPLLLLFSIDRCRLSKRTFVVAASYREPRLMHCGIIVKQQSELCGVASSLSTGRIKWHA